MEPRIQYARTSDGVSIAFAVMGEGRTVVRVPPVPWSHVQREWEDLSFLLPIKPLAGACRIVWYDSRGSGLSDRDNLDFSIGALASDLAAVLDRLDADDYALCAVWDGVPAAIAYTAAHPERVSHLVLIEGYTKGSEYLESAAGRVELGIRDKDWVLYTDMLVRLIWGYDDPKLGREIAEHLRFCAEPEALRAAYDAANYEWDVSTLAPRVAAPTLVINNQNLSWLPVRAGQRLASCIPNCRFMVIDDLTYHSVPQRIADFLELTPQEKNEPLPSGTAIILFADIADSTALTEQMGDAAFREKARELDGALRSVIRDNAGTPIEGKLLGDGVLAVFTSARQAIEAALACAGAGNREGLPLHLGIHAGDVIREENNVYGGAVNIASRISGLSAPGEVLVSETVRSLARTSAGVRFEDRGEQSLKGVGEPVRVWAVREGE